MELPEQLSTTRTEDEVFKLTGGDVLVQKYFLDFRRWRGPLIQNTYNGKAVIDWQGEPVFAELAVLRMFQSLGWGGVWVDSYRRKYRVGLPELSDPIELPENVNRLVESIRSEMGRSGGCWDVLVWKGEEVLFFELKRSKKDQIQDSQIQWLETCLKLGIPVDNFGLVEWELRDSQK